MCYCNNKCNINFNLLKFMALDLKLAKVDRYSLILLSSLDDSSDS
jgi:hypothetical protein